MREFRGWRKAVIGLWLIVLSLFHIYTAMLGIFEPRIQRGIHLLFILPLAFLMFPATKKSPQDTFSVLDIVLAFLSLFPPLYIITHNDELLLRLQFVDEVKRIEIFLGTMMILLVLEAIRRAVVPAMAVLVVLFFGYLFVAPYLSGVFYAATPPLSEIIEMLYLFTDDGIFGSITGVSATFVAIFVVFGVFMEKTRTGQFFTDVACRLAGSSPGGPAKIAVISSGLFGSISGVAAANVYATGVFTIPLMKKLGYRPKFAAAVEASASTGGMLMPPVMGAGAFVMAELTRISYLDIVVAALLGSILYYASLILRVHLTAMKENLKGIENKDQVPLISILKDSFLLLPMVVLVALLVMGLSPFMAAVTAIGASFFISFFRKSTMMTPLRLAETLRMSGSNMVMIALACTGAGMVVAIVTQTGLGLGLASVITNWSGGMLLPALFLVMITSLVLGMGLPCTPAYVIAITVGGPILLAAGCQLLQVHLFVFYFAILAGITPPVCIPAYCAAAIAKSKSLQTGFEAFKLSIVGFLIPYVFIYNPALLMQGTFMEIFAVVIVLLIAIFLFAASLSGYIIKNKINLLTRGIIAGAAIFVCFISTSPQIVNSIPVKAISGVIFLLALFRLAYAKLNRPIQVSG